MEINAKVIINKTSYRTLRDEVELLTSSLLKKIKI